MSLDAGDLLALLALALSGFATWKTLQFNKRQEDLIESQQSLNRRLAQREDKEDKETKQAALSAAFIKLGSSSWKLRVGNKGKAAARNVRLTFVAGHESFIPSDVESKFPMQVLHPHQSVDLLAAVGMGSPSKYEILFEWEDDFQTHNQLTVFPTI
jgi:hypothetical protein